MQPDDVMPNDGTFMGGVPLEPTEQVIERKKERAKALEAKSVVEDLIKHFDDRIEYLGKIDSITENLETDPLAHQKAFHVKKLLKEALVEEKNLLEELLSVHTRSR